MDGRMRHGLASCSFNSCHRRRRAGPYASQRWVSQDTKFRRADTNRPHERWLATPSRELTATAEGGRFDYGAKRTSWTRQQLPLARCLMRRFAVGAFDIYQDSAVLPSVNPPPPLTRHGLEASTYKARIVVCEFRNPNTLRRSRSMGVTHEPTSEGESQRLPARTHEANCGFLARHHSASLLAARPFPCNRPAPQTGSTPVYRTALKCTCMGS